MIIIKILIVLVTIIAVLFVVAMFTKDKYTLVREVTINKPKQEVFDYIKLNRNQKAYSVWLSFDPNTKLEIKGAEDGQPGSILAFKSKHRKTGKGEWETKKLTEGEQVDFELRFLAPFVFTANGYLRTEAISETQTKLKWVYNSGMDWPMNFMLLFMDMDKIIGTDMAQSLSNIKAIVEK
jgi:hypothetical protein